MGFDFTFLLDSIKKKILTGIEIKLLNDCYQLICRHVYRTNFLSDLCEEIHKREWHGEGAEEDVGDGQVGDEDVPRGQHHLVGQEGQDDGEVANHPEDDDQAVEHNQAVVNAWLQSEHPEKRSQYFGRRNEK